MRTAQTVLTVIQERGKQHKPIERVYKLLFNRDFYLNAYAKLYPNNGAMTKGVTDDPYKIIFVYKTGFKNEIGNAKERFGKKSKAVEKAKEMCSHIVDEVKDVCSYVSDNTCGDGCFAFQG